MNFGPIEDGIGRYRSSARRFAKIEKLPLSATFRFGGRSGKRELFIFHEVLSFAPD